MVTNTSTRQTTENSRSTKYFSYFCGRTLGAKGTDADFTAEVTEGADAQSNPGPGFDVVSNEVIRLVPIRDGSGIDVNLRYRPSSGLAVATVYVTWT